VVITHLIGASSLFLGYLLAFFFLSEGRGQCFALSFSLSCFFSISVYKIINKDQRKYHGIKEKQSLEGQAPLVSSIIANTDTYPIT